MFNLFNAFGDIKIYHCGRCRHVVLKDDQRCRNCGAKLIDEPPFLIKWKCPKCFRVNISHFVCPCGYKNWDLY